LIGATIGAASAAIMGGDIGRGALFGAISGAIFAGFGQFAQAAMRFATVPGGIGPMTAGANFSADVLGNILGGAAAGAAVAAYAGADVGEAAWQGAAIAGTLSILTEANRYMRIKMIQQSRKNPLNSGGESGGGPFRDKTKIAGTRALKSATKLENCGPLGGCQGGKGQFLIWDAPPNSIGDYVNESFAGPHDYFSSFFLYDAEGNGIPRKGLEWALTGSYSMTAIPVSAPFAIAPTITQNGLTPSALIYGISSWNHESQFNPKEDDY